MQFTELHKKTIQARAIDLPVNKHEFLALYNRETVGTLRHTKE